MSVGVPVNTSSSSQLAAATTRRRVADSQEDHCNVSSVGGGGNAVVYVPDEEEEATSCSSLSDGGGISSCCPSGSHNNYLVGFLSLRRVRLVWMLMVDNKSQWTAKNMRSASNLGRVILSLLGILVVTFFLIVAFSGGRRQHEFVFSIHPRNSIEKIIREEESSSSSIQLLLPRRKPDLAYQLIHHLSLCVREVDTMRYAQLVIGLAGSGKSTYCSSLNQHCETIRRTMHIVNLDPAAEVFNYPVAMDIRELVSVDVVMKELKCGPNAALIRCMEYLEDSLYNWLDEELENFTDDDYLVFDCPGQIEIFTHVPVLKNFVEHLKKNGFNVCAVYLLDSQFVTDITKFISGCMVSLSAMIQLELPHVNILSKMDLLQDKSNIEEFLDAEPRTILAGLDQRMAPQFAKLNKALIELVEQYSMVRFTPLDLRKERSIQYVLSEIDKCIQFGEDAQVKIRELDEDMDQLEL